MTRLSVISAVVLGLMAMAAGGYFVGVRAERAQRQAAVHDAAASKTLIVIRREILLLTDLRKRTKYADIVTSSEHWALLQLQHIDPSTFIKGSASDYLYPDTISMVNAYRKQFPETILNPDKEQTITRAFGSGR